MKYLAYFIIIFFVSFILGLYCMKMTFIQEIKMLNEQITLRDSVNAQNIRIHKIDSVERAHLFKLLPQ